MFRRYRSLVSILVLMSLALSLPVAGESARAESHAAIRSESNGGPTRTDYGKLPLLFEENRGQTDSDVKFISRGRGYTLLLTPSEAVFSLKVPGEGAASNNPVGTRSDALRMSFVAGNSNAKLIGTQKTITRSNYYISKRRIVGVSNYERATWEQIYTGIDAVFYGNENNQLE